MKNHPLGGWMIIFLSKKGRCAILFLLPIPRGEGGEQLMEVLYSFILSVMASVFAQYICKWLDGK